MQKTFLLISGISGTIAVILGAMGAHALKAKITSELLSSYETGVKYQMYHTLALLLITLLLARFPGKLMQWSGWCFIIGILLFSGSIYILATRELTGLNWTWLGPVTPLGGLFLIAGWILIVIAALKARG